MEARTRVVGLVLVVTSALAQLTPWQRAEGAPITLGVLGDSNSDEYRANDNRGGDYAQTTLNWVESLERLRDVDFGPWGTYGEPRRAGYEFNWARSGARADDLAEQQAGLAQQVRAGRVAYVAIHIGTNDFHPASSYGEVYNGTVAGAALQSKIDGITADIRSAMEAMTAAGAKVVVTGVPDIGVYPIYQLRYPDASRRQIVTNAINTINAAVSAAAAADPNAVYIDFTAFFQALSARMDGAGNIIVGGETIRMSPRSNEPHHLQLDDSSGHAGTVGSALMANGLFLAPLNQQFGTAIPELTDAEMLCIAGIQPSPSCLGSRPKAPILTIE